MAPRERRDPGTPSGLCGLRVVTGSGPWGTDWSAPCIQPTDSTGWHKGNHVTQHGDSHPNQRRHERGH